MSASNSDDTGQLEAIADELYGLRPDEFAAARDEQVRKARGEGQQPLARELAKLRRPTQSAWLINLLWRDQREVIEALLELSEELTRAQAEAAGSTLQELTAQRRQLERALIQRARALAKDAGVDVSASMEREAQETLAAALAEPDVAAEVRSGRLVKPASYAGFGTFATAPARSPARAEPPRAPAPAARKPDDFEARVAQRARERREAAERRVDEARSALEAAASALADEQREAEAARAHGQDLRAQVDQLRERLRELEPERVTAERAAVAAERSRDQAERAHAAAERALKEAEQALQELA
jgi:hypothetical protein